MLKAERKARDLVEQKVEELDEAITEINESLRKYDGLIEQRDRLQAARRALLGGVRAGTGSGGTRTRQEDVVAVVRDNPGSTVGELCEHASLSGQESAVRAHLNRGRGERFLQKDKRWWLRDPKSGVNTVDDIEED